MRVSAKYLINDSDDNRLEMQIVDEVENIS